MTNLAFTNFPRDTFLGFDSLFNTLAETNMQAARGVGYPPYNVVKRDDGHFLIEIAVAGFKKEDIDLTLELYLVADIAIQIREITHIVVFLKGRLSVHLL